MEDNKMTSFSKVSLLIAAVALLIPVTNAYASTTEKLLKQILHEQKLQLQLQQDNMGLLLNATHNTTAQLQISNLYLQNAMVENHNMGARLLQALSK